MTTTALSAVIGVILVLIIVGIDIVFALNKHPGDTFSEIIVRVSQMHAVFPLAVGVIAGHWALTLGSPRLPGGLFVLLALGLVVLVVDLTTDNWLARHTHPAQWALLGMALGSMLWSMGGGD